MSTMIQLPEDELVQLSRWLCCVWNEWTFSLSGMPSHPTENDLAHQLQTERELERIDQILEDIESGGVEERELRWAVRTISRLPSCAVDESELRKIIVFLDHMKWRLRRQTEARKREAVTVDASA